MSEWAEQWSQVDLDGHECEVFEPSTMNPQGWVLVYLHGVHEGSLRDQGTFAREFQRHQLPVICPRTGPTWWTNRICPIFDAQITAEDYVCESVLRLVHDRWHAVPPGIGLFGSSMGGQAVLRMAYKFPRKFPVVAALSPAIDYQIRYHEGDPIIHQMYDDAESVRQDTATLYVHPLNWPHHQFFCCDPTDSRWIESVERLQMKLQSLGIPHECDLETVAGGHGFAYYNQMAPRVIDFLVRGLTQMSERTDRPRR